jgi:hypothetical protein
MYFSNNDKMNNQWSNKSQRYKSRREIHCCKKSSAKMMSVIFLLKLLHCQTYDKRWLGVLPQMQCLVPWNMRWCLRQMAIHLWSMPLSRTVSPSDWNCTYGGTFSINCKECSHFLNITVLNIFASKNLTYLIELQRTYFNIDNLLCSLHIKACFVRNDRNCTLLPYLKSRTQL